MLRQLLMCLIWSSTDSWLNLTLGKKRFKTGEQQGESECTYCVSSKHKSISMTVQYLQYMYSICVHLKSSRPYFKGVSPRQVY